MIHIPRLYFTLIFGFMGLSPITAGIRRSFGSPPADPIKSSISSPAAMMGKPIAFQWAFTPHHVDPLDALKPQIIAGWL